MRDSRVQQKILLFLSYILDFGRFYEQENNTFHGDDVCPRPAIGFSRQILRQMQVKVTE
jgi:hypothetical protein